MIESNGPQRFEALEFLKIMKCGDGVTVGWNCKLVDLVVQSLGRHLTLWIMPFFEALKNLPWRSASF